MSAAAKRKVQSHSHAPETSPAPSPFLRNDSARRSTAAAPYLHDRAAQEGGAVQRDVVLARWAAHRLQLECERRLQRVRSRCARRAGVAADFVENVSLRDLLLSA